jgi:oligoendopeptidase F
MQKSATPKAVYDDDLGELPAWDLTDLYHSPEAQALKDDLDRCEAEAAALQGRGKGQLAAMEGAALAGVLADYEALQESLARVMSYAQLVYSGDMSDPEIARFYQSMQERATAISAGLVFFTLELNLISDEALSEKYTAPELARYRPWINDQRANRPHQLSEDLERLLHEKYVSGRAAWTRLFDETMAGLRFPFDGQFLTSAEILNRLSDSDGAKRKEAAKSLGKVLGENQRLFALITNTLAKDKETEDSWRGFARPVSSRNLANLVEDQVVDALVQAVRAAYPRLSHRYYCLKARWFGVKKLPYWDRNAPLPEDDDRKLSWQSAKSSVLTAYGAFSPEMAAVGSRFFDQNWIDVPVRPGKAPGAFAHPTVPSVHPYLLLNYQGRPRDVMTLAHELGHGVHQVLAGAQGHLMAQTPLTLAETASVFGEMLTFQSLLGAESDPERRKIMLAGKVEDMLNTVVRQIAMHCFEAKVHDERRSGELLPERLCEIWLETQQESLGPALTFDDDYRHYWAYIPHFIHVPFYVYAYAFGDCLVNSLYAVYETAREGFAEKYLEMLRAGGTKRHHELLAPFGLDARDPDFWTKGLDLTSSFIDELEALS